MQDWCRTMHEFPHHFTPPSSIIRQSPLQIYSRFGSKWSSRILGWLVLLTKTTPTHTHTIIDMCGHYVCMYLYVDKIYVYYIYYVYSHNLCISMQCIYLLYTCLTQVRDIFKIQDRWRFKLWMDPDVPYTITFTQHYSDVAHWWYSQACFQGSHELLRYAGNDLLPSCVGGTPSRCVYESWGALVLHLGEPWR